MKAFFNNLFPNSKSKAPGLSITIPQHDDTDKENQPPSNYDGWIISPWNHTPKVQYESITVNHPSTPISKINFNELISSHRLDDLIIFKNYWVEIWRDLSLRSKTPSKGIEKNTFNNYYSIPSILNERWFSVFDTDKDNYLNLKDFIDGMTKLFTASFQQLTNMIFNFYDFDHDGVITKEDVRVVLSYVPIHKQYSEWKMKYEQDNYIERVETQNEILVILNKTFGPRDTMKEGDFTNVIVNKCSDAFIFLLMYLLESKPFSVDSITMFLQEKQGKMNKSKDKNNRDQPQTFEGNDTTLRIALPSIQSKLVSTIVKKKTIEMGNDKSIHNKSNTTSNNTCNDMKAKINEEPTHQEKETKGDDKEMQVTPHRKTRKIWYNINQEHIKPPEKQDLNVYNPMNTKNKTDADSEISVNQCIQHEGYIYKITQSKNWKSMFFKWIGKDMYYFKSKNKKTHQGMHNWSGVYIKANPPIMFNSKWLYNFTWFYPHKTRDYYFDDKDDFNEWWVKLQEAIDYKNLLDQYRMLSKLGRGKYGWVKLAIHKETKREVAIKIMSKRHMSPLDWELAKSEIDILKICQHPNIIKLFDIFENADYIYIVMEYCSGKDLFSYISVRKYRLPEAQVAEIIHKLAMAVFYIHSYGIIHRDLKPENILMTSSDESADIRLVDFGLSKIIGNNQFCTEPFGTWSYVAPEVLSEKPYDKEVDLWSIGVITYLLLSGFLPFDDENSDQEIIRQTINDPPSFPSKIWDDISIEGKGFVMALLVKNPKERMKIKEVLESDWLKKFSKVQDCLMIMTKDKTV